MRNVAGILFVSALTLSACGDNNDKLPDFSTPGGDEGDMSAMGGGDDLSMNLPPDMTQVDQIQAVKNAANNPNPDAGALDLPLAQVIVTYLRPTAIGTDVAGFFVQDHATGPAVFIAVDPATLSPAPVVGDTVSFTVTGVGQDFGVREATAISGFSRDAQGFDVTTWTQDLSGKTDVVTMVDTYESTLIKMTGTIASTFTSSGAGSTQASITTAGYPAVNTNLKIRLTATLQDNIDAVNTCAFTLNNVPLWRGNKTAQPSAWVAGDITLSNCPAPELASATATDLNTVLLKFDRNIKPSTFKTDGTQFMITGGLTVMSATLSGRFVTLVTSTQTTGTSYTVTVDTSLHDLLDKPLDAAHTTATFLGYVPPATLVINEVDQNITGSQDLVELRVTGAGNMAGITLQQDFVSKTLLATLPQTIVAVDDLVVVHMTPAATVKSETTLKTDCADAACYTGAWDVAGLGVPGGTTVGITNSDRLLALVSADGKTYLDVVAFTTKGKSPSTFPGELQAAQAAGVWMPADCGSGDGTLCTFTTTPSAEDVSVLWTGVTAWGNDDMVKGPGKSVQRKNPAGTLVQTQSAADWNAAAQQTWGAPNP